MCLTKSSSSLFFLIYCLFWCLLLCVCGQCCSSHRPAVTWNVLIAPEFRYSKWCSDFETCFPHVSFAHLSDKTLCSFHLIWTLLHQTSHLLWFLLLLALFWVESGGICLSAVISPFPAGPPRTSLSSWNLLLLRSSWPRTNRRLILTQR